MAVSFQTGNDYGQKILSIFKVPQSLIQQAVAAGVTVTTTIPGSFVVTSQDKSVVNVVPVKAQAISMAQNGTLGPSSMGTITAQFVVSLQKAMGQQPDASVGVPPPQEAKAAKPATVSTAAKILAEMEAKKAVNKSAGVGFPPLQSTITSPPPPTFTGALPPLAGATSLLQPVKGTSKTSVYHVAAMMKGINIGIRNKSESLSVRIEGTGLALAQEALEALGFGVNHTYASAHFKTSDTELKVKTLGAVLAGIGMEKLVQVANFKKMLGA